MKKCCLVITILMLAIITMSCAREPPVAFTVKAESAEADVVTEVRETLLRRYNEFLPSKFSKIAATIDGSLIKFVVSNGSPSKQVITYLTESPGFLEAFHFNKSRRHLWFTDQDLISASVVAENGLPMLNVKITSEAATRTARLSTNNIGKKLAIEIDGRTVAEAFIRDTLRASFLVHAPNADYAQEISTVLTFGRLPATVKLESWDQER